MEQSKVIISLNNITIQPDQWHSFKNTSWQLHFSENWAVLGPNGSGKSVLVKAIARQVSLSGGEIRYYFNEPEDLQGRSYIHPGEILTFSAETHRDFFRKYSEYHQARWQSFEGETTPTVSNLLDPERIFQHSPFEIIPPIDLEPYQQKRNSIIDLLGINNLLTRKVHLLSHGESRKVFFARLLLQSPKVLILDDPFTGFDETYRDRFREIIQTLHNKSEIYFLLACARESDLPDSITHILRVEDFQVIISGARNQTHACAFPQPNSTIQSGVTPTFFEMVKNYSTHLNEKTSCLPPIMIEMHDVSISYGEMDILQHIHWTVRQGERWAIRGKNGAGKSSLLSLILADNPQAYRNDVILFEKKRGSGESIWEIKEKIGWVSPELHIFYQNSTTALDVVCSGFFDSVGSYHQYSNAQIAQSLGWMRAFGIEAMAKTPFGDLSTGNERLVLLARAVVKSPSLLVLDEPCQGLDDNHRRFFITLIEQICACTPLTLIYVTHYQDELPGVITHQLILDQGKIQNP